MGFDHSLWALGKTLLPAATPAARAPWLRVYVVTAGIVGAAAWFGRVRRLGGAEKVLFLSVATVLLPPVSYDYTLVHLYAPWLLLVLLLMRERRISWAGCAALGCFAVVFAAEGYVIDQHDHFGAQVKCFFLVGLAISALFGFAPNRMSPEDAMLST